MHRIPRIAVHLSVVSVAGSSNFSTFIAFQQSRSLWKIKTHVWAELVQYSEAQALPARRRRWYRESLLQSVFAGARQ